MKKNLIVLTVTFAIAFFANAQARFGLKAGANLAKLYTVQADAGDEDFSSKTLTGLHTGVFATLPVSAAFSVQPEAYFSMEGGKDREEEDAAAHLNFINIPVLLQYNAKGFIVETGPQIGLLLSAKSKFGNASEDIKENIKSTAFAWALGAGYRLGNGIGLHARYNLGLSHLPKEDDREGKVTSRVLQIGLSYALGSATTK